MKRRGQLLSIDALLSLVIVVMVVGVVMNTNDMIKAEITGLLDWYDRANIANNVLDVLTKNPGYPEDWESNVSNVKMVGLRDNAYPFALDYDKIIALNRSRDNLTEIFNQLARGKDFLFEIYVSKFNVSIEGRFPKVYLSNITLANPNPPPYGVIVDIYKPEAGDTTFQVSYVRVIKDGVVYENTEICNINNGNNIDLNPGDYVMFITEEPVKIVGKRDNEPIGDYLFDPPVIVEVYVGLEEQQSNFLIEFSPHGSCSNLDFKLGTQGNVIITVSAYDNVFPTLNSSYTSARDYLDAGDPFYWFSLINGTFEENMSKVRISMSNSPWIEPVERTTVFPKFTYNLSSGSSAEEPLIYGFMRYNPLEGTSIRIRVNSSVYGNLTLLSQLGTDIRGLFVYGNSTDLNATLAWYENGNARVKGYEGVNGTITMPFEDLFGSSNTINKIVGLWLYSLEGWNRGNVTIEIIPSIEYMLDPKFESVILKLWVWDDR